jgi:hypothetical protein
MHQHGGRVIVAFAIIGAMFTGVSAAARQTPSWPERNLTSFASCDYDAGFSAGRTRLCRLRLQHDQLRSCPLRHHRPQPPVPPAPAVQIHRLPPLVRCSGLNEGHQAHSRAPISLGFSVELPSVGRPGGGGSGGGWGGDENWLWLSRSRSERWSALGAHLFVALSP